MYYEIEICDPLASHRDVHKLGNVKIHSFIYIVFICTKCMGMCCDTIANLHPSLRSTHCWIQSIAVITHPLLKKYGFREVLKPFIDDVRKLYEVCT